MKNKDKYKKFCYENQNVPVFSQFWWLDAVSRDGDWDAILYERNNKIVAAFPFFIKSKSRVSMRFLTNHFPHHIKNLEIDIFKVRIFDFKSSLRGHWIWKYFYVKFGEVIIFNRSCSSNFFEFSWPTLVFVDELQIFLVELLLWIGFLFVASLFFLELLFHPTFGLFVLPSNIGIVSDKIILKRCKN